MNRKWGSKGIAARAGLMAAGLMTAGLMAAGLAAASAVGACAQAAGSHVAAAPKTLRAVAVTENSLEPEDRVLRQIEDPSTGALWLLLRDRERPAGPGRLVLAREQFRTQNAKSSGGAQPLPAAEWPVIHAGDAVVVEEHTAVVDARLAAMAQGPAVKGAQFKARLKIGGNVVRVVALAPGRASIAPESDVTP